ncbi:hypothetical protein [Deinococcus knuensis]|uniref:Uncharacterized protein n=1 Tax=Deinococcus knuensis TaxID=1837380 RepID=A0ABQ2SFW9_9DEIO|nr:hypothetical protein [Deinococcus knuensis]GGS27620.1 hypothetical protein GCM10008961_18950 [Deinococcus knuensis]
MGLLCLTSPLAAAQPPATPPAQPPTCPADWTELHPEHLRAAQVSVPRATFSDARGAAGKYSVRSGDLLLQGRSVQGRRCSYLVPSGGLPDQLMRGFLPDTQVEALPAAPEEAGTWARDANAGLTVRQAGSGALTLNGSATHVGADGNVTQGNLNGPLRRQEGAWPLAYSDGECSVNLRPVGPWMLAADNGRCGGLNVRFDGLYQRVR